MAAISYIAELGMEGQWLYVSPQVETMFGFTADEWLANSREWVKHIHPEDRKVVEVAEDASKRGKRFQAEYRITRKDGQVIWVSDTAAVVPGSDAHPLMEGIIVDITDKKLLEGQLQQARRMEAVGRLAGGIAHDLTKGQFADDHALADGIGADKALGKWTSRSWKLDHRADRRCFGTRGGIGAAIVGVQPTAGDAAEGAGFEQHRGGAG